MSALGNNEKAFLVGDNPFHQISHLSQDRTKTRSKAVASPESAAQLILSSVENGANGFMFSVSKTTLSILAALRELGQIDRLELYPIMPYAYEYVQLATQVGGISGLAKSFGKQVFFSMNLSAMWNGLIAALRMDPVSFMKAYLSYEVGRIRSVAGKDSHIRALVLHEVITDMALGLKMEWFFKAYAEYVSRHGFLPGFNTCNFAFLVNRFRDWDINVSNMVIAAPFNKIGFQMCPSRTECESALAGLSEPVLIAISILAAGYLQLPQAVAYIAALPNIKGVAVGISKEKHASETFGILKKMLI